MLTIRIYFLFSFCFLFSKNKKHGIFKELLVVFNCFLRTVLKNNHTTTHIIIKNKAMNIKIIFKTYLKILKTS